MTKINKHKFTFYLFIILGFCTPIFETLHDSIKNFLYNTGNTIDIMVGIILIHFITLLLLILFLYSLKIILANIFKKRFSLLYANPYDIIPENKIILYTSNIFFLCWIIDNIIIIINQCIYNTTYCYSNANDNSNTDVNTDVNDFYYFTFITIIKIINIICGMIFNVNELVTDLYE